MWSARQTWKMGRRAAGFLGGLLATTLLVAAPAAAALKDPVTINVSKRPDKPSVAVSGRPGIAVNGAGQVFAVWQEGPNGSTQIFFTRSRESCGGLEFEKPRMLSAGTGTASNPAVAVKDKAVFVVWEDRQPPANSEVLFKRSTDSGETFVSVPVNLSQDLSSSSSPSVAADNLGGVFVTWRDGSSPAEILITRLNSAGGIELRQTASQTPSMRNSQAPSVAAGSGSVFLAWEERFGLGGLFSVIRYKKFDRTSMAVSGVTSFSDGVFSALRSPHLAFGDGTLSVAFVNFNAVYHLSSLDGINFSALEPPFSRPANSPSRAGAARGHDSAMVAWAETLGTSTDIRYRLGTMLEPEPVFNTPAKRESPAAAVDSNGRLLVAWQGRDSADPDLLNDDVYVSYSGGTGGGSLIDALVEMNPQTLNAKTMYQGEGVFTLRIRPLVGNAAEIDPLSLKFNDKEEFVKPLRWSLIDTDGNGLPDTLELKIKRSELQGVFDGATLTATQGDGDYRLKVDGKMTGGRCFTAEKKDVRIIHQ